MAWINEIHYDDVGADLNEAVEIAGAAGTDLSGWTLALYNGNGGVVYGTINLTGTIPDQGNGFGTLSFPVPATPGLQNGAPDGLALVNASGTVVVSGGRPQFLSYEGVLTATDGPAAGLTSTDIGVAENGEAEGNSLQLTGTGDDYADFTWVAPTDDNFGAVNTGQSFLPPGPTLSIADAAVTEGNAGTSTLTFTVTRSGDTTGAVTFDITTADGTAVSTGAQADFVAASATGLTIAAGQTTATFNVTINGDTAPEGIERFAVRLSNATGATIVDGEAAATITNDDASPTVILAQAPSLQGAAATPVATNAISLVKLNTLAAPANGNFEVIAYDAASKTLFGLNAAGGTIERFVLNANGTATAGASIQLGALDAFGGANSIAIRNGVLAVAYGNATAGQPGRVALFDAAGNLQNTLTVGVLPDQITFTPDGQRLLVANEAEAVSAASNAAGSISIINLSGGAAAATVATTIGFDALNGSEATLRTAGLPIFRGQNAAQDIEPEYISVSPDGTRAYVTLQEVNAVAVIDLTNPAATAPAAILPLGGVDYTLPGNVLDASDRDGPSNGPAINLANASIRGLLQPDAIASYSVGGVTYFVTANEGDARVGGLADEARLSAVTLDPTAFPNAAALQANAALGRLNINRAAGDTDGDGDIDQIVSFGGRGISIFRQEADGSITKVRETGGEFERIIAQTTPARFNVNSEPTGGAFPIDDRSDNKGPEPEGVTIGQIGGRSYAFVSLERAGGIMVYDVTDPANASFVSYQPLTAATDTAPEVIQFISAADSPTGAPLVLTANEGIDNNTTLGDAISIYAAVTRIPTIQGTSHQSTFAGQTVTTIGVVTAIDSTGFYLQDAAGDGDVRTSDAIFVFTGSDANGSSVPATVQVGDRLQVTGGVSEFVPGGAAVAGRGGLSITQITTNAGGIVDLGVSAETVASTIIGGAGSRVPPTGAFGDATNGNAAFPGNDPLDPATEATDFYESLEGMLVTVRGGRVVGPTNDFGEIYVVVDNDADPANGLNTGDPLEPRGVLLTEGSGSAPGDINPGDYNPERIQIDDDPTGRGGSLGVSQGFTSPDADVGARLGDVTGVVNYDFGNYEILAVRPAAGQPAVTVAQASALAPETTTIAGTATRMTIGTYNVENLDPVVESSGETDDDVGAGKFDAIARHIVTNMGRPDVVALQEVQDGDGGNNTNLVGARATLERLIQAIRDAGGPTYTLVDNPFIGDDTNGGQPGGNIRTAYLYQADRVSLVADSLRTIDDNGNPYTVHSVADDGTFNGTAAVNAGTAAADDVEFQTNPFFASRLPLVADFQFRPTGEVVTVINNHWSSKSNSGPLYGADATPANGAELARNAQAQTVNTFVDGLLAQNANARVVVVGDLNDFEFEEPLRIVEGRATYVDGADADTNREFADGGAQVLFNLVDTAGATDRYSYNFEGNAQSLDHVLVSAKARTDAQFDSVHVNSEFAAQTSDHDPKVISLNLESPAPMNYRLQILHASDFEAGLNAVTRAGNFAAIVDALEDREVNSITLSSGDNYLPSPFFAAGSDASLKEVYETALEDYYNLAAGTLNYGNPPSVGAADIAMLNIIGVQASTIGNHEFDAGTAQFNTIINQTTTATAGGYLGTQFPYLSANIDFAGDPNLAPRFTSQIRNAADFAGVPGSTGAGVAGARPAAGAAKIAPATIITENGERIGVVGATTQIVESISSTGGIDIIGDDRDDMPQLAAILQPTIDALRAQGITKIILSSHLQQLGLEQALAPLLNGVDIIIAGGSHTLLADSEDVARGLQPGDTAAGTYPIVTAGADGKATLIVNTSSEYSYVGRLVVEFDANGDVIPASVNPAVSGAYATTEAGVTAVYDTNGDGARDSDPFASGSRGDLVRDIAQGVGGVIASQDGNTFGRTGVYLEGRREEVRTQETNFGNLSADANLFVGRQTDATVTVSIKNGGGIRDSIGSFTSTGGTSTEAPPAANPGAGKEAGEVSQLDIANSLRFNNALSLVTVTSAQLLQVLEHAVSQTAPGATPGRFAQIGGVAFSYDATRPAGDRVISAALTDENGNATTVLARDGELVADAPAAIRVVTLSFLLTGGDGYPFQGFITANPTFANRVDLDTGSGTDNAAGRTGTATFADNGTEQDAVAEYLAARFGTTPYSQADTDLAGDTRIQSLAARADTVLRNAVNGTDAGETVNGGAADDVINAGGGNDTINGGAGTDTAVYAGSFGDFVAQALSGGGLQIADARQGSPLGTDTLSNVERIAFNEGTFGLPAAVLQLPADQAAATDAEGDNWVYGNALNNVLTDRGGNDVHFGGAGFDTVAFEGLSRGFTFGTQGSVPTVGSTANGTNALISIEETRFVDGRVAYDVADRAAVVLRLYDTFFDRAPDAAGLNNWISAIERGATVSDVANAFAGSAEFQARFAGLSNAQYVEALYQSSLGRAGDASGASGWVGALDGGTLTRAQVAVGFSESLEHIELLRAPVQAGIFDVNEDVAAVARLYYTAFDRAPDAGGLTGWASALQGGATVAGIADSFAASQEFANRYGSLANQAFVEQLYVDALDRTGDAGGVADWTGRLNAGQADRGDVLLGFSNSLELQFKAASAIDGGILFA